VPEWLPEVKLTDLRFGASLWSVVQARRWPGPLRGVEG
jgi:hypothetical protein